VSQHTPGAIRASQRIVASVQKTFKELGFTKPDHPKTVELLTLGFAAIIDSETGAAELLAELDKITLHLEDIQRTHGVGHDSFIRNARATLNKYRP